MTVLQAIVQQLYNDQSSLLMVLNNKDFTIDDLQERDSHLQYQSNFFKKAFGLMLVLVRAIGVCVICSRKCIQLRFHHQHNHYLKPENHQYHRYD
ncbi:unnamed protein product [Adineta steineri]|uniref:Uncharacterized protein n=1 Tax=Adineta steineri TaxID=433720 RepID=A0A818GSU8_9BILA|nr:unnamed protein product [Adineta steineri]CAF0982223.1 unnamed protein product [Adineta steineri]CAF3497098.1 unnamed protein product [Adineta steineri]CAF3500318.1 unnamed protein product [Adineta steineri]CAF3512574.1 unnamed protein product [Adineta steineri]